MLATRPSLEGKWGSGIWEWGCTAEWPYFWNAFTVLPVGHCFWKERNGVSVDMAAVFIYFNTELSFSIPSVLSCNFPFAFCASSLLNQPRSSLPARSFHRLFCSPLVYRSTLVLSLTLTASVFPCSLCGYVDFGHQGEFQGEFCLALCSGLPCGGGIFDNRGCKEPLGV